MEVDSTHGVVVQMPDREPKEAAKKARVKAVSAAKVNRHRSALHEPLISKNRPIASQQPNLVALSSPAEQSSAPQPKQEPLFNFNRLDLYVEKAPVLIQDESVYLSHPQHRSASNTARSSFSSAEVQSPSQRGFGSQGTIQSPYAGTYDHEAGQSVSYVPISMSENSYIGSSPPVVKQFNDQQGMFVQNLMQDVTYTSPNFAKSVRDNTGWLHTPAASQQQVGTHSSLPYVPSMRSNQHLPASTSNQLAQSNTGMPYISEARYLPTQTEYNPYGNGTPNALHHGLPGYDSTNMNTRTYY